MRRAGGTEMRSSRVHTTGRPCRDVQIESAAALDEEADLVLVMGVLFDELGAQLVLLRVVGRDADHVDRL